MSLTINNEFDYNYHVLYIVLQPIKTKERGTIYDHEELVAMKSWRWPMKCIGCSVVTVCFILLAACSTEHPIALDEEIQPVSISAERAKEIISLGESIILDVRSPAEFAEGHIEGAISMPSDEIEYLAPALIYDKNQIILVYCRAGSRSHHAALALSAMGFTSVFDFGGILDWEGPIVTE